MNSCTSCCAGAEDAKVNSTAPGSCEFGASWRETKGGGEDGEVGKHRKGIGFLNMIIFTSHKNLAR